MRTSLVLLLAGIGFLFGSPATFGQRADSEATHGHSASQGPSSFSPQSSRSSEIAISQSTGAAATAYSGNEDRRAEKSFGKGSVFADKVREESVRRPSNYAASLELLHLSFQGRRGASKATEARLLIGFLHPNYWIKDIIEVSGKLDVDFDGVIAGLPHSARVTLAYDLRHGIKNRSTSMKMSIDAVTLRIAFPFSIH